MMTAQNCTALKVRGVKGPTSIRSAQQDQSNTCQSQGWYDKNA